MKRIVMSAVSLAVARRFALDAVVQSRSLHGASNMEPGVNVDLENGTPLVGRISSLSALAAFMFSDSTSILLLLGP